MTQSCMILVGCPHAINHPPQYNGSIDTKTSSLQSKAFLKSINCQIHILFKVIICMFCGSAWAPYAILGHCKNEHPNIKQDPDGQSKLDEIVS